MDVCFQALNTKYGIHVGVFVGVTLTVHSDLVDLPGFPIWCSDSMVLRLYGAQTLWCSDSAPLFAFFSHYRSQWTSGGCHGDECLANTPRSAITYPVTF